MLENKLSRAGLVGGWGWVAGLKELSLQAKLDLKLGLSLAKTLFCEINVIGRLINTKQELFHTQE